MPNRLLVVLKEWKEIIVLLAAVGGLYVVAPAKDNARAIEPVVPQQRSSDDSYAVMHLTLTVDSLNRRVSYLTAQIDALIRLQCVQTGTRALTLAGVNCHLATISQRDRTYGKETREQRTVRRTPRRDERTERQSDRRSECRTVHVVLSQVAPGTWRSVSRRLRRRGRARSGMERGKESGGSCA